MRVVRISRWQFFRKSVIVQATPTAALGSWISVLQARHACVRDPGVKAGCNRDYRTDKAVAIRAVSHFDRFLTGRISKFTYGVFGEPVLGYSFVIEIWDRLCWDNRSTEPPFYCRPNPTGCCNRVRKSIGCLHVDSITFTISPGVQCL